MSFVASCEAYWSPIRQGTATGAKLFATTTRTGLLGSHWMIDYHSHPFPGPLRIRVARSWPPATRIGQNSPIRVQANDMIADGQAILCSISLIHISFFHID